MKRRTIGILTIVMLVAAMSAVAAQTVSVSTKSNIKVYVQNNDDDSHGITLYIDKEQRECLLLACVKIDSGSKKHIGTFIMSKGNHNIEIKWHDTDTDGDYSASKNVYVDGKRNYDTILSVDKYTKTCNIVPCTKKTIGKAFVVFDGPKNQGWARLDLTSKNQNDVLDRSGWYAEQIIKEAKRLGYTVNKSQLSMDGEIKFHTGGYIVTGGLDGHSDPIDIELWTNDWGID